MHSTEQFVYESQATPAHVDLLLITLCARLSEGYLLAGLSLDRSSLALPCDLLVACPRTTLTLYVFTFVMGNGSEPVDGVGPEPAVCLIPNVHEIAKRDSVVVPGLYLGVQYLPDGVVRQRVIERR
jgi:hypothetical protein